MLTSTFDKLSRSPSPPFPFLSLSLIIQLKCPSIMLCLPLPTYTFNFSNRAILSFLSAGMYILKFSTTFFSNPTTIHYNLLSTITCIWCTSISSFMSKIVASFTSFTSDSTHHNGPHPLLFIKCLQSLSHRFHTPVNMSALPHTILAFFFPTASLITHFLHL